MAAKFRYDATLNHLTVDETWVCAAKEKGRE